VISVRSAQNRSVLRTLDLNHVDKAVVRLVQGLTRFVRRDSHGSLRTWLGRPDLDADFGLLLSAGLDAQQARAVRCRKGCEPVDDVMVSAIDSVGLVFGSDHDR
jgi:hypothetical protein